MRDYFIEGIDGTIRKITANIIETKYFNTQEELDIFIRMHPSCFCIKVIPDNPMIKTVFALWEHEEVGTDGYIRINHSYNRNPNDNNRLAEYYKLKHEELTLKQRLETLEELTKIFEQK